MKMKKQAILIMIHNNRFIVEKLLQEIDSNLFDIYLHIDKKSELNEADFKDLTYNSKLYIFKEIDVRWADYSQTKTEIFLLKKALVNNYSYYHLISGNDILIKTPIEIYNYFDKSNKIFVHFADKCLPSSKINWVKYYHPFMPFLRNNLFWILLDKISIFIQKIIFIDRLKKIKNIKIMTGANWFSIPCEFARYVCNNENLIESIFKYTRSSDEMFIQTMLFNSNYYKNVYNNKLDDDYDSCKRFIKWNGVIPKILTIDDYDEMINSNKMFARKVDEKVDRIIIEKIHNYIISNK